MGDRHSSDPDGCGRRGPFKLAWKHRRLRTSERRNGHVHCVTQHFQMPEHVMGRRDRLGTQVGQGD